jgi:hypothetical protein
MSEVKEAKEVKKFVLPNKKVVVTPVKRSGWLPVGHEANFLFKDSKISYSVPVDERTGELIDPLTKEEREYFESKESGLALEKGDLSIYKKENNFWKQFSVKLDKNKLVLDLSNPMDYIRYKVLLLQKDFVAKSYAERFDKASYKYYLAEEGQEQVEKASRANLMKDAYIAFGKLQDNITKLKDVLNVYYMNKGIVKSVQSTATREYIESEANSIIESDAKGFLEVVNDEYLEDKIMLYKALKSRAIEKEAGKYILPSGKVIGSSFREIVAFFNDDENAEELLKIRARIENSGL